MDNATPTPSASAAPRLFKRWWFWAVIAAIVVAGLFIPFIEVPATCMPCPEGRTDCPACPTYHQNVIEYLSD